MLELRTFLDRQVASGDIGRPASNQLQNSLAQVERHLQRGREDQTVRALKQFIRHLQRSQPISEDVRHDLHSQSTTLLEKLTQ